MIRAARPDMVANDAAVGPLEPLAVSIRAAADVIGVCPRTLERRIAAGEILAYREGARRLIAVEELRRYVREKNEAERIRAQAQAAN